MMDEAAEDDARGQGHAVESREARPDGFEARVVDVLRGDLIEAEFGGATHQVHVAGVYSPSPRPDMFNRNMAQENDLPLSRLASYGREAIGFTRDVTSNRPLRIAPVRVETNGTGRVAVDGDVIFQNGSTLAEKLLEYGLAAVLPDVPDTFVDLFNLQNKARTQERGLWRHPVALAQRFDVRSEYDVDTIAVDHDSASVGGQGDRRVETYRMYQKQAIIGLGIRVQPPVWRTYRGEIRYAFHMREEEGRRVQELTAAPIGGDGSSSSKRPSRAERNQRKEEQERVEDYNRQVDGGAVSKLDVTETRTLPFILTSSTTTLVIKSQIEDYMSATKAGISYTQGRTFRGYDLDVVIGTNVVYRYRHGHRRM